ncbi:AraC family transcriptional regulator [Nonomuraea endophytica]|uniref:AraC family transcriptional regulator n=1 Tax=Nonomuraea endophytica TaxID=714136 RepID=UPI0037C9EA4F
MGVLGSWSGRVQLRPGRLTYVGELGSAHAHAHAAVQLLLVSRGAVVLTDERGARRWIRAALIPAGVTHAMHAVNASGACVYLDPAGKQARILLARVPGGRRDVEGWAADEILPVGAMNLERVEAVIASLTDAAVPVADPHPALLRATELIETLSAGPIRLTDVSLMVGMSPGRLRHLFSDHLGLPFSAYVRWARLRKAMQTVKDGSTLTRAAHAAGFADSAHLTRVSHAMFGLAPSHLAKELTWV